jgi:hypothetical protein
MPIPDSIELGSNGLHILLVHIVERHAFIYVCALREDSVQMSSYLHSSISERWWSAAPRVGEM